MKRFFFIILGAISIGVVAFGLLSLSESWIEETLVQSDDDINATYAVCLAMLVLSIVAGGFIGNRLASRQSAK